MVMDATQSQQPPSPQSVGREFVRQYYTLLNKAPNHLHRFYNNHSSFIHGESTLVVGQKNIYNRIQQLNFHDCHAKISQVDAQATLGNGVVVQVTGELSNDGQPMRRFTQTFVLAAQSPKKYYVHNDIFRYQDIYSDEENDVEARSENGDDHEQVNVVPTSGEQQGAGDTGHGGQTTAQVMASGVLGQQPATGNAPQQAIYYSIPTGGRPVPVLAAAPPQAQAVPLSTQFTAPGAAAIPPQQVQPTVTQLNGVIAHEDVLATVQQQTGPQAIVAGTPVVQAAAGGIPIAGIAAQTPTIAAVAVAGNAVTGSPSAAALPGFQQPQLLQQQLIQQTQSQTAAIQQPTSPGSTAQVSSQTTDAGEEVSANIDGSGSRTSPSAPGFAGKSTIDQNANTTPIVEDFKSIHDQQQQEKYEAAKQQQNEPKTYANLFKSMSSSPSGFVNSALPSQHQTQTQQTSNVFQSSGSIPSATFTQSGSSSISNYNRSSENSSSGRLDNNNLGGPLPQRSNSTRMGKDFETRRTSNAQQFGDNQQLFLGNIPHHATEEELKAIFTRFGTVLELRILSKQGGKMQPGVRNPLNYGFITYEDPESVQNCLQHGSIYFPENSPEGQKLNIEEKKPRMRSNDMPPRQSMGGSGGNMNSMGGGNQRNMSGGPQSRSGSNSGGGMMRGNAGNNSSNMSRGTGSGGGPRLGGGSGYNNRSGSSNGGGSQIRSNNTQAAGGGSYAGRR